MQEFPPLLIQQGIDFFPVKKMYFYAFLQGAAGFFMPYFRVLQDFLCLISGCCRLFYALLQGSAGFFLWLLPLRQVATMSSRCKSVMSVLSVHSAREVFWDAMQTRYNWLGIFTALVQDYLTENFSRELLF